MKSLLSFILLCFLISLTGSLLAIRDRSPLVKLKGIVLSKNFESDQEKIRKIQGVHLDPHEIPHLQVKFRAELEKRFIGRTITPDLFMHLRSYILQFYRENHLPDPRLSFPIQDFQEGVVQLLLLSDEKEDGISIETPEPIPSEPSLVSRERPKVILEERPIIPYVQTLVLVSDPRDVGQLDVTAACGLLIHNVDIPSTIEEMKCALEPIFFSRPLTQEMMNRLKHEIIFFYRNHHRPVVTVYVPKQDVTSGIVYIVVD